MKQGHPGSKGFRQCLNFTSDQSHSTILDISNIMLPLSTMSPRLSFQHTRIHTLQDGLVHSSIFNINTFSTAHTTAGYSIPSLSPSTFPLSTTLLLSVIFYCQCSELYLLLTIWSLCILERRRTNVEWKDFENTSICQHAYYYWETGSRNLWLAITYVFRAPTSLILHLTPILTSKFY